MFKNTLSNYCAKIESRLDILLSENDAEYNEVIRAARYSLLAGGKRIRPILLLEFYRLCGGEGYSAYNFACAVEMIHTYSLIHDDLPCMDNDDFRRGNPSCHKKFGEDIALLAGDALLTEAFGVALKTNGIPPQRVLNAAHHLSKCAGINGMIGGQVMDITGIAFKDAKLTRKMYLLKTSALINASVVCGAVLAGADEEKINLAGIYADKLGLAFQITDDILDDKGDSAKLGKPVGSDAKNNKETIASRLGTEKAKELADRYTNEALSALSKLGGDSSFLKELTVSLLNREY